SAGLPVACAPSTHPVRDLSFQGHLTTIVPKGNAGSRDVAAVDIDQPAAARADLKVVPAIPGRPLKCRDREVCVGPSDPGRSTIWALSGRSLLASSPESSPSS